jgi:hypothetical protein
MNALNFGLNNVAESDMREMALSSPCAVYPPIPVRSVTMDTAKGLIAARKKYIVKMLSGGKQ